MSRFNNSRSHRSYGSRLKAGVIGMMIAVASLTSVEATAKPVDFATAKRVAISHYLSTHEGKGSTTLGSGSLTLVDEHRMAIAGGDMQTIYYVFTPSDGGFVIVAGDDAVLPVLGYSHDGTYSTSNPAPQFVWWMKGYERQIAAIAQSGLEADGQTRAAWRDLLDGKNDRGSLSSSPVVEPLMTTEWDQHPYYNEQCPYNAEEGEHAITGCVATSFAQIMKHHNWPERGTGAHGYTAPSYGYLHVDFGSATYDWKAMPDRVSQSNPAVAQLMYHLGVAFEMDYGTSLQGGSGAYPIIAAEAMKNHFSYSSTTRQVKRHEFTDESWTELIREEMLQGRPVEYHGYDLASGGHSFVVDGCADDYFHVNWGWGGMYNGYFILSNLAPDPDMDLAFDIGQGAVIGIEPERGQSSSVDDERSLAQSAVSIYPLPASTEMFVRTHATKERCTITLFDIAGNRVMQQTQQEGSIPTRFDIQGLAAGAYMVAVESNGTQVSRMVMKQ